MSDKKRIVIIGATSAIAEQCALLWVADAVDLILVARNTEKVELVAMDLRVRSPQSTVETLTVNFLDPIEIQALVNNIVSKGNIDMALIAHGSLPDQKACQKYLTQCGNELQLNGISPTLFAEAFITSMEKTNSGTLAVIGSVAGDRGRKSNYVYGAAKGLVTRYVQGLQHRLAKTNVKVVLIKPGPTDTPMTAHLKQQGAKLASVESVAENIVQGIEKGQTVIYAPAKWMIIMMIIRHLPGFVFNKMDI